MVYPVTLGIVALLFNPNSVIITVHFHYRATAVHGTKDDVAAFIFNVPRLCSVVRRVG